MLSMSKNQQAVIDKYGFAVTQNGGFIEVTDEVIKKFYAFKDASKKGVYHAKSIDAALRAAIDVRMEHDASVAAGKSKSKPAADKSADTAPAKTQKTKPAATKTPPVKTQPAKSQAATKTDTKPEKKTSSSKEPPVEIGGDVELDNTGKRERNRKARVKKTRAPNRYLRASQVIIGDLSITQAALAQEAGSSLATAGHCLEAWHYIVGTLLAKNVFTPTWQKRLADANKPLNERRPARAGRAKKTAKK